MPDHEKDSLCRSIGPASAKDTGCDRPNISDPEHTAMGFDDFAIDWQAATPGWGAIFIGVALPIIAVVAAVVLVFWMLVVSLSTGVLLVIAVISSTLCFNVYWTAAGTSASDKKLHG